MNPAGNSESVQRRIAARYAFEARISIQFNRDTSKCSAQGWARDLSESGLGAFVAEKLVVGELVVLQVPLGPSGKQDIAARVASQIGTQCGFQFTALSAEQRPAIQSVLKGQSAIP